jgi:hypothetical protein
MSDKSMLGDMPYNMSTKGGGGMLDMPPFLMSGKGMEGFSMAMDHHRTDFTSPGKDEGRLSRLLFTK